MTDIMKIGVGVGVLIIRDGKVLLGLRNPDLIKAGSELQGQGAWTMPGGKVDPGERLDEAARRELAEETGLTARKMEFFCVQDDIKDSAHYVTVGFMASIAKGDSPSALEPETILEWRWFDFDNLPPNLYNPSKKFIEKYQSGVSYDHE